MDLAGFEKIAPHLAHPLVLVGFVLLLAYGIHWQLMKSGLLSKVQGGQEGQRPDHPALSSLRLPAGPDAAGGKFWPFS